MTKLKRIRIIAGIILVGVIIYMGFSAFRFTNDIKNSSETMRSKKIIAHRGVINSKQFQWEFLKSVKRIEILKQ